MARAGHATSFSDIFQSSKPQWATNEFGREGHVSGGVNEKYRIKPRIISTFPYLDCSGYVSRAPPLTDIALSPSLGNTF